ncbi:maleylpyruvate isomerase family mycothiol-dependent enzyme [Amycolatopsis sp. NPDC059027]|uniref:maleylpyruvate isomerase family mycothiol-dependent enzyme n=1 Tax=unclassified Amycolatopsis TaxID=2618356 RepID=UPI00366D1AC2
MEAEEIWQAVDVERRSLIELLETLSDAEWEQASLCDGWRVRDVVAHVVLATEGSLPFVLGAFVRARGNFNRAIRDSAVRYARRAPAELLTQLRGTVGQRRCPPSTVPLDRLMDMLVHGQDIAIPLGRPRAMPPAAARAATERAWTRGFPFHPQRKLAGYRLRATDVDWSGGEGALVEGPISALLLLVTGRKALVGQLSGPGSAGLASAA